MDLIYGFIVLVLLGGAVYEVIHRRGYEKGLDEATKDKEEPKYTSDS